MNFPRRIAFRKVDGLFLLDKPQGLSSNQALQKVRRIFRAEKGGHTGALDPLATGLLPLCFGEATKIAGLLLSESKAYRARIQFGVETDTDDAEGQITRERPVPSLSRELIEAAAAQFIGNIRQVPPRYSALKREGEPLYVRARRGEVFDVPAREVYIANIEFIALGESWVDLEVTCGSGTYIRSLARDLGDALACGGHITQLRRLWVEPFRQPVMYTLEQLEALAEEGDTALFSALLPIELGLMNWRRLRLDEAALLRYRQGQRLTVSQEAGDVLVMDRNNKPVGLAEVDADGLLLPRRLFHLD